MARKSKKQEQRAEFALMHRKRGCEGCSYCDKRALFKRPCCTYAGQIEVGGNGWCLTRKEVNWGYSFGGR